MINATEVREIVEKIKTEQENKKKEIAIRLVNEVIEPSIIDAAKKGEHSTIGTIESEYLYYVRKEIEKNGFTTTCVGLGKLRIFW